MRWPYDHAVAGATSWLRRSITWRVNIRSAAHAGARCHRIDAVALAHFSQRLNCLASQETTSSSAPMPCLADSTELPACGSYWRSPQIALPVRYSLSCARRVSAQTAKHDYWARVGPRPSFVARSVRVWARMQTDREGMHVYGRPNDFVCRFVFSCRAVVSGHTMPRGTCVACRVLVIGTR